MPPTHTPAARIDADDLQSALDHRLAREVWLDGLHFVRYADDVQHVPRGTVVLDGGRVVPSYPSIGRIFVLKEGIRRAFQDPFHAEEKLDGYNIRIVRHEGRLLPFTRGGFVCPFTEDRLADLGDFGPLFDEDPDLVLCGEIAGPDNPYIATHTPRVVQDVAFFAFDLMRVGLQGFVPLARRDVLFERHAVPHVPGLGCFNPQEAEPLVDVLCRLHVEGAEGIVLKPPGEGLRVKYVTPGINLSDVRDDSPLLAELPPEFFVNRLVRLAIGLRELGLAEQDADLERKLGHAVLSGFMDTLRRLDEEGVVARTFSVKVHSEATIDRLLHHLDRVSTKIQVRELERGRDGDLYRVTFRKTYQTSTSQLRTLLAGQHIFD
jgi:putative ATP-dependent DNA ligase